MSSWNALALKRKGVLEGHLAVESKRSTQSIKVILTLG